MKRGRVEPRQFCRAENISPEQGTEQREDSMSRVMRCGAVLLVSIGVGLVFNAAAPAAEKYASVKIGDVPAVRQEPDFCGEACAQMWLNKLGKNLDQNFVFNQSGLDPALGRGCYTADLVRALTAIGFHVGPVWQTIPPEGRQKEIEAAFRAMHGDLLAGIPSIVCMHYDDKPNTTEHFRLILGYDARTDEVVYNEPAEAKGAYRRMPREMFLRLWPLKSSDKNWTLVRISLGRRQTDRRRAAGCRRLRGKRRPISCNTSCGSSNRCRKMADSRSSCSRRSSSWETNRRRR